MFRDLSSRSGASVLRERLPATPVKMTVFRCLHVVFLCRCSRVGSAAASSCTTSERETDATTTQVRAFSHTRQRMRLPTALSCSHTARQVTSNHRRLLSRGQAARLIVGWDHSRCTDADSRIGAAHACWKLVLALFSEEDRRRQGKV
ncbi:hypothetical protein MTO96_005556 [Rhipicephalus appendiculatus]